MLIDSLLIVLRETLEAGVLISLLLSLSVLHHWRLQWFWLGLGAGLLGAIVYANYLAQISTWFDYVGQEIVNASLQYALYFCLLLIVVSTAFSRLGRLSRVAMALAVSLAVVREGSEIWIFISGYMGAGETFFNVFLSGFLGLMIGLSVGVLSYFSIASLALAWARPIQLLLLCLVASGLVVQATQLLIQADIIGAAYPLWDTGRWLPEQSIAGQIVYAVFGYEATPSLVEVIVYAGALLCMAVATMACHYYPLFFKRRSNALLGAHRG